MKNILKILIKTFPIVFFCALNSRPNDNLIFKSTAAFPARPVYTLPSIENGYQENSSFSATAFVGSTLPLQDSNKKMFESTLRKDLVEVLFDVLAEGAFFDPQHKSVGEAYREIVDILGGLSTESHRVGAMFRAAWAFDHGEDRDPRDCTTISASLPIMASFAHFFVPFADLDKIKQNVNKITGAMEAESADADSEFLGELKNSEVLKKKIYEKFGPTDLRVDITSPRFEQDSLGARISLEGIFALDRPTGRVGKHLSINRDWLIEFERTGAYKSDLQKMIDNMVVGGGLPVVSTISSLIRSQVTPLLDSWGHGFGPVLDLDIDFMPGLLTFFSKLRANLYFGKSRKAVIVVDDFYQPSEFTVATDSTVATQFNFGTLLKRKKWTLKVGYDFFYRTSERIRFVYDAYRNENGIDYFAEQRLQVAAAGAPSVYQHRLFANLIKTFRDDDSIVVNVGIDGAFNTKFMPKNLNISCGMTWKF